MTDGKMITTRGSLEWWERLIRLFLRIFLLIMLCLFLQRKIHRQSTSDNERGGKSWAGMVLISCTFSKYVGLLACTCFCIYGRRDTKKMGSVLMFHSFVLEIQFHYFRKRSCVTKYFSQIQPLGLVHRIT